MTSLFLTFAKADQVCAEQLRQGLEAQGYRVWREPTTISQQLALYPRTIEQQILSSAVIVLLWSAEAAQIEQVEQRITFAQSLLKPLLAVTLDTTPLPASLTASIGAHALCADALVQLLPHLPSPQSSDSLLTMCEKAAHEYLRERKEAIMLGAEMLARDEQRDAVVAVLRYLAQHDLMMGVREKAQEALDADTKRHAPVPASSPLHLRPEDARHIFGIRCTNGHVTYYDKRLVCAHETLVRLTRGRGNEREIPLELPCGTCPEVVAVTVDCRGY